MILDDVSTETPTYGAQSPPASSSRPPLVRRRDGRLIAGVCNGVAEHLGVPVTLVRFVFALLGGNGVGVIAYLAIWFFVPRDDDDGSGNTKLRHVRDILRALLRHQPGDPPHRRRTIVLYVVVSSIIGAVFGALGIAGATGLPLTVALVGALLIWWRAPQAQRARWTSGALDVGARLPRRSGPLLVMAGGIGLVIVGVTAFLAAHDALAQARAGALAIAATFVGVLLVTAPWLFRLLRDLGHERRERIREHERAEVAAHVHDSVLQTLALIQSRAADPDAVRRLARRQERELRGWLYRPGPSTEAADEAGTTSFASALRHAAAGVEDEHGVTVDVVIVGDAPLDDSLTATVAAAREAMVNAAKSSGEPTVSLFAEVSADGVEVFVRDRGRGFDPNAVPDDRRGIRDSIVGRMTRHGGSAHVRSSSGTGTEVALSLNRRVRT